MMSDSDDDVTDYLSHVIKKMADKYEYVDSECESENDCSDGSSGEDGDIEDGVDGEDGDIGDGDAGDIEDGEDGDIEDGDAGDIEDGEDGDIEDGEDGDIEDGVDGEDGDIGDGDDGDIEKRCWGERETLQDSPLTAYVRCTYDAVGRLYCSRASLTLSMDDIANVGRRRSCEIITLNRIENVAENCRSNALCSKKCEEEEDQIRPIKLCLRDNGDNMQSIPSQKLSDDSDLSVCADHDRDSNGKNSLKSSKFNCVNLEPNVSHCHLCLCH